MALGKTSWCETKQGFIIFTTSKGQLKNASWGVWNVTFDNFGGNNSQCLAVLQDFFHFFPYCEKKKHKEVLFLILLTSQTIKSYMENAQDFYFQKEHSLILYFPHFSSICSSLFLIYRWGIYKLWPTFRLEPIFICPLWDNFNHFVNLSCLANNRKSFFVPFYSSSCRYAENFKPFPLLSFTSLITFGSFISQTSVCLLIVFSHCLPLRMLAELLPFLPKSHRFLQQDQAWEEHPLELPPCGCVRGSPQPEQSQIPAH